MDDGVFGTSLQSRTYGQSHEPLDDRISPWATRGDKVWVESKNAGVVEIGKGAGVLFPVYLRNGRKGKMARYKQGNSGLALI